MDPNPPAALSASSPSERQKFFEDIWQPETEFVFPCPICILSRTDVSSGVLGRGTGLGQEEVPVADLVPPRWFSWPFKHLSPDLTDVSDHLISAGLAPPEFAPFLICSSPL